MFSAPVHCCGIFFRVCANAIAKSTGCKGTYSLMRLPCHDPINQCVPDSMHTPKDVLERIFALLTGKEDTPKMRKSEEVLGRFDSSTCTPASLGKRKRSPAISLPYCLTKEQLKLADERAVSIITPSHVDFKPGAMFCKPTYMKSHDWKQVYVHACINSHVATYMYN